MVELGLLDDTPKDRSGATFLDLMRELAQAGPGDDVRRAVAARLGLASGSAVLSAMDWLGLFEARPLAAAKGSSLDNLSALMIERLAYAPGERDMVVLQHEFLTATASGLTERIVSTLVDYGIPNGDSSMSRTVGLPAAIGARLVLEGKIALTGVQVPVRPEIYVPILEELEARGVRFTEKRQVL